MKRLDIVLGMTVALVAASHALPSQAEDADARRSAAQAALKSRGLEPSLDLLSRGCIGGDAELVQIVLDAGVDPNQRDPMLNRSPLSSALVGCIADRVPAEARDATIAALLEAGADPNSVEMGGIPAFMGAARQCPRPVIEAMFKAGGDLDVRSPQGFTPLSMALIVKNLDAAEALLDLGARLSEASLHKLYPEPPKDPRLAALVERAQAEPPPE